MNWRHRSFVVGCFVMANAFAAMARADTMSVKLGVQQWKSDVSGYFGEASDATISPDFAETSQHKFLLALEHPLPLVPNLALSHSENEASGMVRLAQTYRLGEQLYSVASVLNARADYSTTDLTFYYEMLDSSLIGVDLGVQVRYLSADFHVDESQNSLSSSADASDWQPMAYAKLHSALPLVGLRSYVQLAKGDDNHEYEMAVGYQFVDSILADMSVFIGYKDSKTVLDKVDGIYAEQRWESVFVGLELAF